jgi:hypothetical protein
MALYGFLSGDSRGEQSRLVISLKDFGSRMGKKAAAAAIPQ